jgi:hypothetical protein
MAIFELPPTPPAVIQLAQFVQETDEVKVDLRNLIYKSEHIIQQIKLGRDRLVQDFEKQKFENKLSETDIQWYLEKFKEIEATLMERERFLKLLKAIR